MTVDHYHRWTCAEADCGITEPRYPLSVAPDLDVERLARAIKARLDIAPMRRGTFSMVDTLDYADAIAAEYFRLTVNGPPGAESETKFVWLIERGQPEGYESAVWLTGDTGHPDWSSDPNRAARFLAKEDADRYIARHGGPEEYIGRPVLHGFVQDFREQRTGASE